MRKLIHSGYQNTHKTSLSSMIEDICVVVTETGLTRLHLRKARLKMRHNRLVIINRGKYILTDGVASVQSLDTDVYFATSKSPMAFILVALLGKFQLRSCWRPPHNTSIQTLALASKRPRKTGSSWLLLWKPGLSRNKLRPSGGGRVGRGTSPTSPPICPHATLHSASEPLGSTP